FCRHDRTYVRRASGRRVDESDRSEREVPHEFHSCGRGLWRVPAAELSTGCGQPWRGAVRCSASRCGRKVSKLLRRDAGPDTSVIARGWWVSPPPGGVQGARSEARRLAARGLLPPSRRRLALADLVGRLGGGRLVGRRLLGGGHGPGLALRRAL